MKKTTCTLAHFRQPVGVCGEEATSSSASYWEQTMHSGVSAGSIAHQRVGNRASSLVRWSGRARGIASETAWREELRGSRRPPCPP